MNDTAPDAASIFAPLWRRKWLILAVGLIVAAGTYYYYKHKPLKYGASTQLYFGSPSEQQGAGSGLVGKAGLSARGLSDQVGVINSAIVGEVVHRRLRHEHKRAAVHGKAKASASATSDFITINTEAATPRGALALANTYAQVYIERQHADYLRNVNAQLLNLRQQLRRIEPAPGATVSKGKGSKPTSSSATALQAANLASKISQLENALSTFTGVQQVGTAKGTGLLGSSPKKNAIFGFVLGLLLASIAAYAASRLDRRLRSLAQLEEIFHAQILAALPSVRNPIVRRDGPPRPAKALVEPLRRLHVTLQLGDMLNGHAGNAPRAILAISADAGDGRSTVIANLARVQADGGERVAVIEADFRRPALARMLDVGAPNGLAQVLAGRVGLGVALQRVHSVSSAVVASPPEGGAVETLVETAQDGSASVLLSGGPAPNPPALLASDAMADLVRSAREDFDYVLIDAPPPLEVSDVMPLLPLVDGIVIVARLGHTREVSAQRLAHLLARTSSAPLLGVVGNCAPRRDIERYGFAWAPAGGGLRNAIGR